MKKTVCIDLDGVLADYSEGWKGVDHIGEPIPGAQEFVKRVREIAEVVIYTTRCNEEVNKPEKAHLLRNRVAAWLDKHGFEYDHVYAEQGKPIAVAYIDDRAVPCAPQAKDMLAGCTYANAEGWLKHLLGVTDRPEPKHQEVVLCNKDGYIPLSTVVDALNRNIQIRATLGPDDSRRRGVNTAILMWLVCHWDELYARLCAEPEPKPLTCGECACREDIQPETVIKRCKFTRYNVAPITKCLLEDMLIQRDRMNAERGEDKQP